MIENMSGNAGHCLTLKTFHKPTFCQHCSDLLWGITNQGLQCLKCKFVTHEKCQSALVAPCNATISAPIQIPQAHSLKLCNSSKKKFCASCHLRLENPCFECEDCAYCIHSHCRKSIKHNCKITSSFTSTIPKKSIRQNHHWIEEHLSVDLTCEVCDKHFSNMDSFSGLRCSWCLNTVHSHCMSQNNRACDFGPLHKLVLPPYSVKQFSSDCLFYKPVKNMDCACFIFESDMNNMISWKSVSFTKDSTVADVLIAAIESFKKTEDSSSFYLTGINMCDSEMDLHEDEIFSKIYPASYQQIFLRHKWINSVSIITVHAGNINAWISSADVIIKPQSTINDLIENTLKQLYLKDKKPEDFSVIKMKLRPDLVAQNYFQYNERSYNDFDDQDTKFYLQPKKEPMSEYSLFIGNLPTDLSRNNYQVLLSDQLGGWEKDMCIKAIFSANGGLVVSFNSLETFQKLSSKIKNITISGKHLFSYFLPEIVDECLSPNATPLLVFVNSKSGGGQGEKLLTNLRQLLNPYQVVDLLQGGPLPALYMFRNLREFRILICGGDGTFGWVLSCIDEISSNTLKCKQPASALLPLGTGNDLARVLNWGAGYTGEPPLSILQLVENAEPILFDRWSIMFDYPSGASILKKDPVKYVPMNNYFSIGIDAEVCLEFHAAREEHPEKFSSRMHNKGIYFKAGIRKLAKSSMTDLQNKLILKVDGKDCKLPTIQGLAIVNINSWGGGADPWGKDVDEKFKVQSYSDGNLEVVGFTGVYHLGKIKSGFSTGIRIAQGTQINLELKADLPVQVDGEPWLQQRANIFIRPLLNQVKMLFKCNEVRRRTYTSFTSPKKGDLKLQSSNPLY
ncbi:diacylglycerol kinase theta isoform X2 [Hydra vulgaris]|uniref:Diacylglycerol kinase n=1 Tax=Hydra vulgaris TaxID=6087 RepID=A0ABM4BT62_HYDVU